MIEAEAGSEIELETDFDIEPEAETETKSELEENRDIDILDISNHQPEVNLEPEILEKFEEFEQNSVSGTY